MLEEEINFNSGYKLTNDFMEYWKTTWDDSHEGRCKVLYMMLCVVIDKMQKQSDGIISLDVSQSKLDHKTLRGTYKRFLI